MPHVCEFCDQEFARKFNLDRHQERRHRDDSAAASGEVVVDPETGSYRDRDIFDASDMSSGQDKDAFDSLTDNEKGDDVGKDDSSMESHDEETETDESVMDSQDSAKETDTEQSGSESDAGSDASSGTASTDESQEYGYDSGDEEEWTLYRDWTIPLPHQPGDIPQRVIKETKRAGKKFYLIEFAALPHHSYEIEYTKNWVSEQTLMKKYGYLVLK
uniref:C2H2-type domain-containing protein n=1 Tax=Branchiostoma floridae TaxID=7739 RepID=C3YLL3_BRAFL|eukprot:XP_002602770.1 hypothetical protein BRAFLDRAFT_93715 [Branchiostoma floridae]